MKSVIGYLVELSPIRIGLDTSDRGWIVVMPGFAIRTRSWVFANDHGSISQRFYKNYSCKMSRLLTILMVLCLWRCEIKKLCLERVPSLELWARIGAKNRAKNRAKNMSTEG